MEQKAMQNYIDGLNNNDPKQIGTLFAENGYFSDGATRLINLPDGIGTGPEAVAEIFTNIMTQFQVKAEILKMNKQSMEYNVYLGDDILLPCIGTITVDEEGKIMEYLARPR